MKATGCTFGLFPIPVHVRALCRQNRGWRMYICIILGQRNKMTGEWNMWKIFQEEFYKIASKKIVWIGLFCLLGFVRYRLAMVVDEYTMTTAGKQSAEKKRSQRIRS